MKVILLLAGLGIAGAQTTPDLKSLLGAAKVSGVQIDYVRETFPSPMSKESLDKMVERTSLQMQSGDEDKGRDPVRQEARKQLTNQLRENLEKGTVAKYKVTLQPGTKAILASFEQQSAASATPGRTIIWNYLDDERLIEYNSGADSVIISTSKAPQRSLLGVMLFDAGSWGNPLLLGKEEMAFNATDLTGTIKYPAGQRYLKFVPDKKWIESDLTKISGENWDQEESRTFGDFEVHGPGLILPKTAINHFKSPTLHYKNTVGISGLDFSDTPNEISPSSLPQLGLVTVNDNRFEPPLVFKAFNILPTDEEITALAVSKDNVNAYNEKILKMATGK